MKGYVNLTHTNNSAIQKVSQKVDEIQDDYVTKDTTELTNYYTKNQTYSKDEIDNKTTNVYRAKGSVQTYQDLPTENNQVGDVYNVIEAYEDYPAGTNFVWTDTSTWDALGGEISIIQGVSQEDFNALVNNETLIKNSDGGFLAGDITTDNNHGVCIGQHSQSNHAYNIVLGNRASSTASTGNSGIVIGFNSKNTTQYGTGIAIGDNANTSSPSGDCIQLGTGTNNTPKTFQIDDDNIYNWDTHTLKVQNAEINGTPAYGVLSGTSAPTTTTVGAVGQFYLDTTNKQLYQCMSITQESVDEVDTNVYEWQEVGGGGSGEKKYMHCLAVKGYSTPKVFMNIVTNSNSPITSIDEIKSWLIDNGYVYDDSVNIYNVVGYPVTGGWYTGTSRYFYDTAFVDTVATNPVTYRFCVRRITIGVTELLVDDVNYYTVNNSEPFAISKYTGVGFDKSNVSDKVIEL